MSPGLSEPSEPSERTPSRGESTRAALISAATEVFARDGFHAVSTRTLAQAAGVNQALIGYHFGGKEGLYLAVFDDIAARLLERVGPLADALEQSLAGAPENGTEAERRARFLPPLLALCDGMLLLMLGDETARWSQLILREQQNPTAAFERLYAAYMGRLFGLLTRLVQQLRGDPEPDDARMIVVGIVGNVLIWRAARATVLRHLQWPVPGLDEVVAARAAVRRSVTAQALWREPA